MTLKQDLKQFTGSEHLYEVFPHIPIRITDGVKYFADKAQAYWAVMDIILTVGILKLPFTVAEVTSKDGEAHIVYEDGNGKVLKDIATHYPTTDLEEGTYTFWITDNVMLLPSEY